MVPVRVDEYREDGPNPLADFVCIIGELLWKQAFRRNVLGG